MRPLIGVTTNYTDDSEALRKIGFGLRNQTGSVGINDYTEALLDNGAAPVLLPAMEDQGTLDVILDHLDGLLISGGNDLDPTLYGQQPLPQLGQVEPIRDLEELYLTRRALEKGLPVFGICRGLQVLNVAMGGSLIQDLSSQRPGHNHSLSYAYPKDYPTHTVELVPGSFLDTIFHRPALKVNSFHHQAVDQIGDHLKIAARAEGDIVEALEWEDDSNFVISVQWHPEALRLRDPEMDELFSYFIRACQG